MHLKYATLSLLLLSASSAAGNSLQSDCDKVYYPDVFIQAINLNSNWNSSGPAVNVKVNNVWYAKKFIDSANDGFYQLAYQAYILQRKVNICAGDGIYRGIEFG